MKRKIFILTLTLVFVLTLFAGVVNAADMHLESTDGIRLSAFAKPQDITFKNIKNPSSKKGEVLVRNRYQKIENVYYTPNATSGYTLYQKYFTNPSSEPENFKIKYPEYLKIQNKLYDVVLTIGKINFRSAKFNLMVKAEAPSLILNSTTQYKAGSNTVEFKLPARANTEFLFPAEVAWNIEIYKAGTTEKASLSDMYLALSDIDVRPQNIPVETYKINGFKPGSNNLVYSDTAVNEAIRVADGSFYSTASSPLDSSKPVSNSNPENKVYCKIDTLTDGTVSGYYGGNPQSRIYTGFGSTFDFAIPSYTVFYVSENGTNTGQLEEHNPKESPNGATNTPLDGYSFDKWVANIDVTLKDGTSIKAGEKITEDQIKNVVLKSDVMFTAINVKDTKITTSVSGGQITPTQNNIKPGESRTISYSPNDGYTLKKITVDGGDVDITKYSSSYTFSNISDSHSIDVQYEQNPKLAVSLKSNKTTANPRDEVKYSAVVSQVKDNATAKDVVVGIVIPEGMSLNTEKLQLPDGAEIITTTTDLFEFKIPELSNDLKFDYYLTAQEITRNISTKSTVKARASNADAVEASVGVAPSVGTPDIDVIKEVANENYAYGQDAKYKVTVIQLDERSILNGTKIVDNLPDGLKLNKDSVKVTPSVRELSTDNNSIVITNASVSDKLVIEYTAKVTAVGKDLKNKVTVTRDGIDAISDSAEITIDDVELEVGKTVDKKKTFPGDKLRYTVRVASTNNIPITDVKLIDELPSSLENIQDLKLSSAGNVNIQRDKIVANISKLSGPVTLTFTATVKKDAEPGVIRNIAYADSGDDVISEEASVESQVAERGIGDSDSQRTNAQTGDYIILFIIGLLFVSVTGLVIYRKNNN